MLAQLKQPFSAAAGSSAAKARPTQPALITDDSMVGHSWLVYIYVDGHLLPFE